MIKLFLLKPHFTDTKIGNNGQPYFCPDSAMIEGVIKYYPKLEDEIEIHDVDFERPRYPLVDLLGPDNQTCPVLVIEKEDATAATMHFRSYENRLFVNSKEEIAEYLASKFKIGFPHP